MKNSQVAEFFIKGNSEEKTKNLFIENNVLYSYGYHFPLCIKIFDNDKNEYVFILNSNKYSNTTTRHKYHIKRALINSNSNILSEKPTDFLKTIINNNIQTLKDLALFNLSI